MNQHKKIWLLLLLFTFMFSYYSVTASATEITPEQVQQMLRQKDISLSVAEIVNVRELLLKQMDSGQELSEQELESVTGGAMATICLILSASLLIGAMVGGAAVGAGTVGAAYIVNDKTNGAW